MFILLISLPDTVGSLFSLLLGKKKAANSSKESDRNEKEKSYVINITEMSNYVESFVEICSM